jgi:hypothetical protein
MWRNLPSVTPITSGRTSMSNFKPSASHSFQGATLPRLQRRWTFQAPFFCLLICQARCSTAKPTWYLWWARGGKTPFRFERWSWNRSSLVISTKMISVNL